MKNSHFPLGKGRISRNAGSLDRPFPSLVAYTTLAPCFFTLFRRFSTIEQQKNLVYFMVASKTRPSFTISAPRWATALAGLILGIAAGQPLAAQDAPTTKKYEELTVDATLKGQTEAIRAILRQKTFQNDQQRLLFDNYFTDYFFARWSVQQDVALLTGHSYRPELRIFLRTTKSGEVYHRLNTLTLEVMKKLVAGNFHPAVRVNAVMTIGELNVDDETFVPLPDALKELVSAAENTKYSYAIRVAAMIGVVRHVGANGLDEESRKSLTAAMLRLAAAEWPTDSAAVGQQWLLARTLETLGLLHSVGEKNAAFNVIFKAAGDAKLPLFVRTAAVDALGQLEYSGTSGVNVVETTAALGEFALAACDDELRRLEKGADSELRRRMIPPLNAVLFALTGDGVVNRMGIGPLAQEAKLQTFLAELRKTVADVRDQLDDAQNKDQDMEPQVKSLRESIDTWLKKKP